MYYKMKTKNGHKNFMAVFSHKEFIKTIQNMLK